MKKIATMLVLAAMSAASWAQSQTTVMNILKKDGTTVEYNVSDVENITFAEKELPKLSNQYAVGDQIVPIGSVVYMKDGGGCAFGIYEATHAEVIQDTPDVYLYVSDAMMGKDIDLAQATSDDAVVSFKAADGAKLSGNLKVAFDKFKKNVTISLEGKADNGTLLRMAYSGAFALSYKASNEFASVATDGTESKHAIGSVLSMTKDGATNIAFSNVNAAQASDMLAADNAVWFSLSASKIFQGTIDLASAPDSYTFKYIDYATGTVYDEVTSGTITTEKTASGLVYFALNVTLADGTVVRGDYFGSTTEVASLDEMIPVPVMSNKFIFYNQDGVELQNKEIVNVKYSTSGTATTLYFLPEGGSEYDSYTSPQLSFDEKLVNAGKIDLSQLKAGDNFSIKFSSLQLFSPEDKYMGYSNVPNNGTLSVNRDADGNYDVYLEITNRYTTPAMGTGEKGDNTKLVISYKGTAEKK